MAVVDVNCVACEGKKVIRHGQTEAGDQRYRCKENGCGKTFKLSYRYKAREHGVKDRIVDMALNFNARPSTPPIMDPKKLEVFTPGEEDLQRAAQVLRGID